MVIYEGAIERNVVALLEMKNLNIATFRRASERDRILCRKLIEGDCRKVKAQLSFCVAKVDT